MDVKGFFLGVIAAVVLFMLWKKENGSPTYSFQFPGMGMGQQPVSGPCTGCSPSAGAAPSAQAALAVSGLDGQISPGAPPLNAATGGQGATSFYTNAGVTPDTSFSFIPVQRNAVSVGSPVQPPTPNVPGSATTPAAITPVRATQQVPSYAEGAFQQRYNIVGIPRTVLSTGSTVN